MRNKTLKLALAVPVLLGGVFIAAPAHANNGDPGGGGGGGYWTLQAVGISYSNCEAAGTYWGDHRCTSNGDGTYDLRVH